MRRAFVILVATGLGLLFGSVARSAGVAAVTIDSRSPALEELKGGGWTTSLGFTNLTAEKVNLTAKASDSADIGCDLKPDKTSLPAAEHSTVVVKVPAGCKVGKDGFDFNVSATGASTQPVSFVVTAAPKPEASKPEWGALWAFPAFVAALLAGVLLYRKPFNQPLKYLGTTWSFKDSWVSNITVAGGLLTGILGSSDVVTALLGKDGKSSVALASVGAAIAIALTGAGAIVLQATKTKIVLETTKKATILKDGDFFSAGGLLAASALTLAGAYGELFVVWRSGRKLDLGGIENWLWVAVFAAFGLLAVYGFRTLAATLKHGSVPAPPPPASDTMVAAKLIIAALKSHPDIDAMSVDRAIDAIGAEYPSVGTSPGDDYPRPRRGALL